MCIGQACELVDLMVMLRAGAAGLLPASTPPQSVANAVMASLEGEAPIPRRLVWGLVEEFRSGGGHVMLPLRGQSAPAELSDREWEVLCLLDQGLSTREVAERISVSAATVRSHVASIERKLGVEDPGVHASGDRLRLTIWACPTGAGWRPTAAIPIWSAPCNPTREPVRPTVVCQARGPRVSSSSAVS